MRRKGVTPVIAVILLLLIVVVMIGGVFTWMNLVQEDIEEATREQVIRFIDDVRQDVYIVTYSCGVEVYVHNSWEEEIENVQVYLNGQSIGDLNLPAGEDIGLVDEDVLNGPHIAQDNYLELSVEGRVIASETFRC